MSVEFVDQPIGVARIHDFGAPSTGLSRVATLLGTVVREPAIRVRRDPELTNNPHHVRHIMSLNKAAATFAMSPT